MIRSGIIIFAIIIMSILGVHASAHGVELLVENIRVSDGDTFKGMYYQLPMTVRLKGIDTFESRLGARLNVQMARFGFTDQYEAKAVGIAARERLKQILASTRACVVIDENDPTDSYGRFVGKARAGTCGIQSVFAMDTLVREGLAYVDYRGTTDMYYADLKLIEAQAKASKLGIWKYTK